MENSIDMTTGLMFFLALALVAFIVYLIKIWGEPDDILVMKEEWQGEGKMDEQGRWS